VNKLLSQLRLLLRRVSDPGVRDLSAGSIHHDAGLWPRDDRHCWKSFQVFVVSAVMIGMPGLKLTNAAKQMRMIFEKQGNRLPDLLFARSARSGRKNINCVAARQGGQ
jgi:hypothetical protein